MGDLTRAILTLVIGLTVMGLGWVAWSQLSMDELFGAIFGVALFYLGMAFGGLIALWGLIQLPSAIASRFGKR